MRSWGRFCPVCERRCWRFRRAGVARRPDAACPWCGARERTRLLWLYLDSLRLPPGTVVLHVAPEPAVKRRLRQRLGGGYITGDLRPGRADHVVDLQAMDAYPSATFDVVIASHVLEHVPDDKAAMREIRRVLKPSGSAVLMVPTHDGPTDEDPSASPEERTRRFGQADHVRMYGADDFHQRLESAGLAVFVVNAGDLTVDTERLGIARHAGAVYVGRPELVSVAERA